MSSQVQNSSTSRDEHFSEGDLRAINASLREQFAKMNAERSVAGTTEDSVTGVAESTRRGMLTHQAAAGSEAPSFEESEGGLQSSVNWWAVGAGALSLAAATTVASPIAAAFLFGVGLRIAYSGLMGLDERLQDLCLAAVTSGAALAVPGVGLLGRVAIAATGEILADGEARDAIIRGGQGVKGAITKLSRTSSWVWLAALALLLRLRRSHAVRRVSGAVLRSAPIRAGRRALRFRVHNKF